jgi:hypothetical protein
MLLAFGGTAWADDWADCKQVADDDRGILACTSLITGGGESDHNLAVAYAERGYHFVRKRNYDLALADVNKAIELNPQLAVAYQVG